MIEKTGLMKTLAFVLMATLAGSPIQARPVPPPILRMYTLDCGRIDFADEKVFSDTDDHDGEKGIMPVSCFLIRHSSEWLLWDAGLGDPIADSPEGRVIVGLHFRVPRTLRSQLALLGLQPDDIHYLALSHLHADHSGNLPMFPHAILLLSPKEYAWAAASPTPQGVRPDIVADIDRTRFKPVPDDLDVFGDGSVRMISTPGHTPGHHSLLVQLRGAGSVLLTGDVAHFQVNYDRGLVPLGNTSRADTLASIDRVKKMAAHYHARVVIQHGANVFAELPTLPAYLD